MAVTFPGFQYGDRTAAGFHLDSVAKMECNLILYAVMQYGKDLID